MSTLLLIRHGQASYGAANYDVLSELGVRQARALGARWARDAHHLDALYSGPLQRQVDTAAHARAVAAAAGHDLPESGVIPELTEYAAFELISRLLPALVATDPELRPLLGGPDALRAAPALADRAFWTVIGGWHRGELNAPGVETFVEFTARVRRGLERVMAAHPRQRVGVVSSGGPISVAVSLALRLEPAGTLAIGQVVRNASITELRWRSRGFAWRPGDFSLFGFNHVPHLALDEITHR